MNYNPTRPDFKGIKTVIPATINKKTNKNIIQPDPTLRGLRQLNYLISKKFFFFYNPTRPDFKGIKTSPFLLTNPMEKVNYNPTRPDFKGIKTSSN